MTTPPKSPEYIPVADIEVSSVRPEKMGFSMHGRGADGADYRIDLELEVPVDQRTRSVLGELLSQSRWKAGRKPGQTLKSVARAHRPQGKGESA